MKGNAALLKLFLVFRTFFILKRSAEQFCYIYIHHCVWPLSLVAAISCKLKFWQLGISGFADLAAQLLARILPRAETDKCVVAALAAPLLKILKC